MAKARCPNCGQPVRPGARYCGACRTALSEHTPVRAAAAPASPVLSCPACGRSVVAGTAACPHCGEALQTPREPEQAQAQRAAARGPADRTRLRTLVWLALTLAACCAILAATAYWFREDLLAVLVTATPPPAAVTPDRTPTGTRAPVPTPVRTPVISPSPAAAGGPMTTAWRAVAAVPEDERREFQTGSTWPRSTSRGDSS